MKLGKNKTPPPRRQRPQSDLAPGPSAFSYHARRSEYDINLGRDTQREPLSLRTRRLGNFWLQRFGLLILLLVVLVSLLNSLLLSPSVRIMPIAPVASQSLLRDPKIYEAAG